MKKILLLIACFTFSGSVHAFGIGFAAGSSPEEWDYYDNISNEDRLLAYFGGVLDTNVAKDRVFNYRLTVAYAENSSYDDGPTYRGITTIHDFGLRILARERFRMWVGPQLVVSYFSEIDPQSDDNATYDGTVTQVGIGPVFGFNLNLPSVITFAFKVGVRQSFYVGDVDATDNGATRSYDVDAETVSPYFSASMIFRIDDEY